MKSILSLVLVVLFLPLSAFSQRDLTLNLTGRVSIKNVQIKTITSDSVTFTSVGKVRTLPLDRIESVDRAEGQSSVTPATIAGVVLGAGTGFFIGYVTKSTGNNSGGYYSSEEGTNLSGTLAAVGGVTGGMIGLLSASRGTKNYEMSDLSNEQKAATLRALAVPFGSPGLMMTEQEPSKPRDVVSLRNGSRIRGSIVELIPDSTVKIITLDSSVFVFRMDEVEKITKEESVQTDSPLIASTEMPVTQASQRKDSPSPDPPQSANVKGGLIGGVAIPIGNFSAQTGGAASSGFAFGAELFTGEDVGMHSSLIIALNGISGITSASGINIDYGSWVTIWPMFGVRVSGAASPTTRVFGSAQLGVLIGNSPEITAKSSSGTATLPSDGAVSFALGFGGGLILNERFTVGARYLYGEPEYELGGSVAVKQSSNILLLSLGITL